MIKNILISLIKLLGTMIEIVDMIEVVTEGAEIEMAVEDLTDMNPQEKEEVTIEVSFKLFLNCFTTIQRFNPDCVLSMELTQ